MTVYVAQPLTAEELAALLRKSTGWIYKQCRAGLMPHTRIGRSVRFTDEHVHQILAAGEQAPVRAPVISIRTRRIA